MNFPNKLRITLGIVTVYIFIAHLALQSLRHQSKNNVDRNFGNTTLLVVAHPDDETMFFGPTIFNLLERNKSVVILCMSNGNADNRGPQRELEFAKVVRSLGPYIELKIVHDSQLMDSEILQWDTNLVARYIENHLHSRPVKTLISFDQYGISGHTNHRSVNQAVLQLKRNLKQPRVDFLVLKSINILRKYMFFLDAMYTAMTNYLKMPKSPRTFSLALDLTSHSLLKQILKIHDSQMVWYRQLYITFSRYMFINDLEYLE